jgi:hypothetical protein
MKAVARGGRVIAAPGLSRDSLTRICGDQVKPWPRSLPATTGALGALHATPRPPRARDCHKNTGGPPAAGPPMVAKVVPVIALQIIVVARCDHGYL